MARAPVLERVRLMAYRQARSGGEREAARPHNGDEAGKEGTSQRVLKLAEALTTDPSTHIDAAAVKPECRAAQRLRHAPKHGAARRVVVVEGHVLFHTRRVL